MRKGKLNVVIKRKLIYIMEEYRQFPQNLTKKRSRTPPSLEDEDYPKKLQKNNFTELNDLLQNIMVK